MTRFRLDDLKFDTSGKAEALGTYEFGRQYGVGEDRTFCLLNCSCHDYDPDVGMECSAEDSPGTTKTGGSCEVYCNRNVD